MNAEQLEAAVVNCLVEERLKRFTDKGGVVVRESSDVDALGNFVLRFDVVMPHPVSAIRLEVVSLPRG